MIQKKTFWILKYFMDKSPISKKDFCNTKKRNRSRIDLVGPHRDDFVIINRKKMETTILNFRLQRAAKIGDFTAQILELDYIELKTAIRPTLLLDDISLSLTRTHTSGFEYDWRTTTIMQQLTKNLSPKDF